MKKEFTGILVFSLLAASCTREASEIQIGKINFSHNWEFTIPKDTVVHPGMFLKSDTALKWEAVDLPHTARTEPLVITDNQWQGTCFYRKFFQYNTAGKPAYVAIRFGAAMHEAEVFLNGRSLKVHQGGYLPFEVELTPYLREENCILVKLNNEDNPRIPPGKIIERLDFNYYGGLYREAFLINKKSVRFTHPAESFGRGAQGVMLSWYDIDTSGGKATLRLDAEIMNHSLEAIPAVCELEFHDPSGKIMLEHRSEIFLVPADSTYLYTTTFRMEKLKFWSPADPVLYKLNIRLESGNETADNYSTRTGIREIRFDSSGFTLNGRRTWIRGTNRHQEYPYIGYALSNQAQYRDARKIKDAGFDFVRLSHYPQAESFLDACDELGLMVMDAIPGWQYFGDSLFRENAKRDLRTMIRRDRNHPSIILWEASLNETRMTREFMEDMHFMVKRELPWQNAWSCGWMDSIYDVFIPARQHARPPGYWNGYDRNKPLFIAEYGDWEYYAHNAGFNQTEFAGLMENERSSRQLRAYGQRRLSQQALNFQEAHNSNLRGSHAGDANWLMYDYNRGYAPDLESSGIMDIFRLPKFSYYFYKSQRKATEAGPVIYIANYWNDPGFTDVKIYSNCEEVELLLNGRVVGKQGPDNDRYSDRLLHPPFTFRNVPFEPGTLIARGFLDGNPVTETTRTTPGKPAGIRLEADLSGCGLRAGTNDLVFIHAHIIDESGNIVPDAGLPVFFSVKGNAGLVGNNPAVAEAGTASILLRAGDKRCMLKVTAGAEDLKKGNLSLKVK